MSSTRNSRSISIKAALRFGGFTLVELLVVIGIIALLISILAVFRSGHSAPPTWSLHDDGDGRDGGGSASEDQLKQALLICQMRINEICCAAVARTSKIERMLSQLRCGLAAVVLMVGTAGFVTSFASAAEPVDVNHASMQELMRVPGMTEVWAQRIIRFRPYHSKLDLLNEGIVTAGVYARIRDGVVAHRMNDKH